MPHEPNGTHEQYTEAAHLENTFGIVLAAGQGKRMKTTRSKVAHTILGKPLVVWATESLIGAGIKNIVVVISPHQKEVEAILTDWSFPKDVKILTAYQETALGTGDAARCAMPALEQLMQEKKADKAKAHVVIGFGDTPAVRSSTFSRYFAAHIASANSFTVLAMQPENPAGYGRVLRDTHGSFEAIREEKDCNAEERKVTLCNSGFLCATYPELSHLLPRLSIQNKAGEYYLTELPILARQSGLPVGIFSDVDCAELEGINSQEQLAQMACYLQRRKLCQLLAAGVQILNPDAVYIEDTVTVESDVIIEPFVCLLGNTQIKKGTRLIAGSRICNNKMEK